MCTEQVECGGEELIERVSCGGKSPGECEPPHGLAKGCEVNHNMLISFGFVVRYPQADVCRICRDESALLCGNVVPKLICQ